jgi:glycosyltransferase involved in cell wall biosynthesis
LGWSIRVEPLFGNDYLRVLYANSNWRIARFRLIALIARAYIHRLGVLGNCRAYDIIWVEKELFPYLPKAFERILVRMGIPYVVDFDDAIFHNYDDHHHILGRRLLSGKLDPLLAAAGAVTVGNAYLADYVQTHGAHRVERIPTVIDIDRYAVVDELPDLVFRIGWIGSPSTAQYLPMVYGALMRLAQKRKIVFVTVGSPPIVLLDVPLEQHDWTLDNEVQLIQSFHVGIMPLSDSHWERGKCGYKLIQYMACGRPVVASPVGVNCDIVNGGVGMLPTTEDEWYEALDALASDSDRRLRFGTAARQAVEREYTLQVTVTRIDALFRSLVGSRG